MPRKLWPRSRSVALHISQGNDDVDWPLWPGSEEGEAETWLDSMLLEAAALVRHREAAGIPLRRFAGRGMLTAGLCTTALDMPAWWRSQRDTATLPAPLETSPLSR